MKRGTVNKKMSGEQQKARKRRVRFLVLMIIGGIGAALTLHLPDFPSSGAPEYTLLACVCAAFVLTFLISGIGLFANLFQWLQEDEEFKKFRLEKLFNSKNPADRRQAAKLGYKLDALVHDPHPYVREAVAEQGYGLDVLVHDKDWRVRVNVARQGYGLDILVHDEEEDVRRVVEIVKEELNERVYAHPGDLNSKEG